MYYTIENRTDKEVGNVYPQAGCLSQNLTRSIKFDEFVNFDSELLFQLEPKAKLTDVLSQASIPVYGLLINKKVKDLLQGFNLMRHRYYKCLVKDHKGITHDYYWLHVADNTVLDKIEYGESKFYTIEYGYREGEIALKSYDDYKIQKERLGKMWSIGGDFIKFKQEFDFSLDLFCIPIFGKHLFISEKLANSFQSAGITGVLLTESSTIV